MRRRHFVLLILLCGASIVTAAEPKPVELGIRVECYGQLRHGLVAIGGETTGTTISFNRVTWELKLPDDASRALAAERHKQPVSVVGTLSRINGTQIPVRWILQVEKMEVPGNRTPKIGATVTAIGQLRHDEAAGDQSANLVIDANGTVLPLDFTDDEKLLNKAKTLIGKMAAVEGEIVRPAGSKPPAPPQIQVSQLKASNAPLPE